MPLSWEKSFLHITMYDIISDMIIMTQCDSNINESGQKIYKKCIEYCLLRVCNSNFYLFSIRFSFFFFRTDTMCSWLSSSVTSKTLGVFVSSLFWMPYSAIIGWLGRWLANHIQKISRCSMCTMQQLLSDFFPTDNRDALFSDQPQSIGVYAYFFLQSFAASISHGSICRCSCC